MIFRLDDWNSPHVSQVFSSLPARLFLRYEGGKFASRVDLILP